MPKNGTFLAQFLFYFCKEIKEREKKSQENRIDFDLSDLFSFQRRPYLLSTFAQQQDLSCELFADQKYKKESRIGFLTLTDQYRICTLSYSRGEVDIKMKKKNSGNNLPLA